VNWGVDDEERQIMIAAASGLEEQEIACLVGSTAAEVKAILNRVMERLGLASRLELLLFVHVHWKALQRPAA